MCQPCLRIAELIHQPGWKPPTSLVKHLVDGLKEFSKSEHLHEINNDEEIGVLLLIVGSSLIKRDN